MVHPLVTLNRLGLGLCFPSLTSSSSRPVSWSTRLPLSRVKLSEFRRHATPPEIDLDALIDDLDIPELDADLSAFQAASGAVFGDDGIPVTFGNNSKALDALENGIVLTDRSHWGRLRVSGPDRLSFLHGQSTSDIASLQPGTGCSTVLVDAQARTIDLIECLAQGSGVMVIVSPNMASSVLERLDKYIFPGDSVQVNDISSHTAMFSILGPDSDALMGDLQAGALVDAPPGSHTVFGFNGKPVVAAVGGGLPGRGYTFIVEEGAAADLWRALETKGAIPMGTDAWEIARVQAGRPCPGSELTSDYNPLETALYSAVSLNKGCYTGQETLAKVHGQGALRRELWGLTMDAPCQVGDQVFAGDDWNTGDIQQEGSEQKAVGAITSYVDTPWMQHRALAYLRCRFGGTKVALEGKTVVVNGVQGRVVRLPFATRVFSEGAAPEEGAAARRKVGEAAAEAARRDEKLRAMQERLAVWQSQQDA